MSHGVLLSLAMEVVNMHQVHNTLRQFSLFHNKKFLICVYFVPG